MLMRPEAANSTEAGLSQWPRPENAWSSEFHKSSTELETWAGADFTTVNSTGPDMSKQLLSKWIRARDFCWSGCYSGTFKGVDLCQDPCRSKREFGSFKELGLS